MQFSTEVQALIDANKERLKASQEACTSESYKHQAVEPASEEAKGR
jgi:hypothetical protein